MSFTLARLLFPQSSWGGDAVKALILSARREYVQAMRDGLRGLGDGMAQVDVEMDALRAMQLVPAHYDLIVLDAVMETMDGLQLLLLMKPQAPATRFVIVGDVDGEEAREQAYQNGADFYLLRPLTPAACENGMKEMGILIQQARDEMPDRALEEARSEFPFADLRPPSAPSGDQEERLSSSADVAREAPPRTGEENAAPFLPDVLKPGATEMPPVVSYWKVNLMGELVEGSRVTDPERSAFITTFIYRKMADIAVALELDYFDTLVLAGPREEQVLVADNFGIRHAVFDASRTTEAAREQFVEWCHEQGL